MTKTVTLCVALGLATLVSAGTAHADLATDRVVLYTSGGINTGCPTGQRGFTRVKQLPDGSSTSEPTEFQVPSGKYLEISSIVYTLPRVMPWAQRWWQEIQVTIRQRAGTQASQVFFGTYKNPRQYVAEADGSFTNLDEFTDGGGTTHAVTYPVGPLMSNAGRLCAGSTSAQSFWDQQGQFVIRGRLIDSDLMTPPDGPISRQ